MDISCQKAHPVRDRKAKDVINVATYCRTVRNASGLHRIGSQLKYPTVSSAHENWLMKLPRYWSFLSLLPLR